MPRGDGTGPRGMGSMTGRGAGYCTGVERRGDDNFAPRRSFGIGFGRGWGFRGYGFGGRRFGEYATPYRQPDPELEKQALKNQAEALQSELDFVKKRLGETESQ